MTASMTYGTINGLSMAEIADGRRPIENAPCLHNCSLSE